MTQKRIFWIIKVAITIFILAILINTIKPREIISAFRGAERAPMVIAFALLPLNLILQIVKWRILLKSLKPTTSNSQVVESLLVGFTLGLATPGRLGELARAFAVRDCEPLQVMGLSLADKFYNLACIALFGGLGILTLPGMVLQQNLYIIISCAVFYAIGAFVIIYLAVHPGFIRGLLYSISLMLPIRKKLQSLIRCLDGLTQERARLVLLISILFYFTFIAQFFILTQAFSQLSPVDGFRGLPAIIFTKTFLPISIGGLGVGELASVRFLSLFKVQAVAAFNASLLLFTINVLIPGIVGLFFIPKLKFLRS
jgi:uncharacterized protein (TIRG00374 family)